MRPGGTQTKRGTAVRMRRRLGLAPRAYALLSCSLVLVVAGVSAYGMTVPSMVQAHAAREAHVGSKANGDLGTITGYAWASVVAHVVFGVDDAGGAEAPDNEVRCQTARPSCSPTPRSSIAFPITAFRPL